MTMQEKLIYKTESGYFVAYYIDKEINVYEEAFRMKIDFLEDEIADFFATCEIFDKIKEHITSGTYFCVFKNHFGVEWWTVEIEEAGG